MIKIRARCMKTVQESPYEPFQTEVELECEFDPKMEGPAGGHNLALQLELRMKDLLDKTEKAVTAKVAERLVAMKERACPQEEPLTTRRTIVEDSSSRVTRGPVRRRLHQ